MTEETTRPQNLLVVASHDWPAEMTMMAKLAIARWHQAANRPHITIHTISSISGSSDDGMLVTGNRVIYDVIVNFARHGIPLRQHAPDSSVAGERRAVEFAIEQVMLRPNPGEEIDHVIALIFNNDRVPSIAVMHANMTNTPNTIIRINDDGRI